MTAPPELPGILAGLGTVLQHYGYVAVAGLVFLEDFGVPVPGETVMVAAAVYAGAGRLNLVAVAVIAVVAAVVGDNLGFLIGRKGGRPLVLRWGRRLGLTPARYDRAERFVSQHGAGMVVAARFIEGLRQANGLIAGVTGMPWRRFLASNILGAALWVGLWVTVGDTAGKHLTGIYHAVTHAETYLLVALVVAAIALLVVRRRRRAGRADQADQAERAEPAAEPGSEQR